MSAIEPCARGALAAFCCLWGIAAHAGPAMFSASFIMRAFGNDIVTGTAYPQKTVVFSAIPLGDDCYAQEAYTRLGEPASRYCSPPRLQQGRPATGTGVLSLGSGAPASLMIPQSAVAVSTTGFLRRRHWGRQTYASFANEAGTFFAGSGPAAGKGTVTRRGYGTSAGSWVIREGLNGFGGAMGLLGSLRARGRFVCTNSTYCVGNNSMNMIRALGRSVDYWYNPYTICAYYTRGGPRPTTSFFARALGSPWTTGAVTIYAWDWRNGFFTSTLRASGYDERSIGGYGNIQLVTPALTHWIIGPWQHAGHVGVLTIQVPEPGRITLLVVGLAALMALHRWARRSTPNFG